MQAIRNRPDPYSLNTEHCLLLMRQKNRTIYHNCTFGAKNVPIHITQRIIYKIIKNYLNALEFNFNIFIALFSERRYLWSDKSNK